MIINLTPHALNIQGEGEKFVSLPPSGEVARVSVSYNDSATIELDEVKIPVRIPVYGEIVGLPDPVPGNLYIVSGMVKAAVPGRDDVLSPGELIRAADGQPIGCDGLKK